MILFPFLTLCLSYIVSVHQGSLTSLWQALTEAFREYYDIQSATSVAAYNLWQHFTQPEGRLTEALLALLVHIGVQLLLLTIIPGPIFIGPTTDCGFKPSYVNNGKDIGLITLAGFILLAVFYPSTAAVLFTHHPQVLLY